MEAMVQGRPYLLIIEGMRLGREGGEICGNRLRFPEPLHASGHISADDLLWCIREMQPHYLLPVHTGHRAWFGGQLRAEPVRVVYGRRRVVPARRVLITTGIS
ncbi:MAG: hypothetical protein D6736_11985 [Nitrospinota bacterium]|nr:MAG: hypothetical protein D6736_11985 [Nitrospinota bacterium]